MVEEATQFDAQSGPRQPDLKAPRQGLPAGAALSPVGLESEDQALGGKRV